MIDLGTWFYDYTPGYSYVAIGSGVCTYDPNNPNHMWATAYGTGYNNMVNSQTGCMYKTSTRQWFHLYCTQLTCC